jgi:hypothetical protein
MNDHHRLQAIRNTIDDLKSGRPFDHRQAALLSPWPALFRLVVEQPAVNRIEIFETCARRLARKAPSQPVPAYCAPLYTICAKCIIPK